MPAYPYRVARRREQLHPRLHVFPRTRNADQAAHPRLQRSRHGKPQHGRNPGIGYFHGIAAASTGAAAGGDALPPSLKARMRGGGHHPPLRAVAGSPVAVIESIEGIAALVSDASTGSLLASSL